MEDKQKKNKSTSQGLKKSLTACREKNRQLTKENQELKERLKKIEEQNHQDKDSDRVREKRDEK